MNYQTVLIIFQLLLLVYTVYRFQKLLKKSIGQTMVWKDLAEKKHQELVILTDQYRQVAKINQALREITSKYPLAKKGKK